MQFGSSDPHWFWHDRRWPADAYGWTFLGNAVLQLGAAIEEDWQDTDPSNAFPRTSRPSLMALSAPNQTTIGALMELGRSAQLADEAWATSSAAHFRTVIAAIAPALREGAVECGIRQLAGGAIVPFARENWNVEADVVFRRFRTCGVNTARPFDTSAEADSYLFLQTSSFSQYFGLKRSLPHAVQQDMQTVGKGRRGRRPGSGAIDDSKSLAAIKARAGGDSELWWGECEIEALKIEPKASPERISSIQKRLHSKLNQAK